MKVVIDITLSARNGPCLAGVSKNDFKATRLQHFVRSDPVDPGRFHHDRFSASCDEPIGHALQITGKCLECLHRLIAQIGTDGDDMESRANIDTGGERLNDR
jgi:hypothetical protein